MNTIKIDRKNTELIAHRGLCGIETENTMSSFVAACNRSYMAVETDVHATIDGEFVLIHDAETGRVAGDNLQISKTTYACLKNLILNDRSGIEPYGEEQVYGLKERTDLRIPRLSEYVKLCKKYEKKCVIEIKRDFPAEEVEKMVKQIDEIGYLHNSIFISFDIDSLIIIRKMCPEQEIELLAHEFNDEIFEQMKKYSFDIDIKHTEVTQKLIDIVHSGGHKINCWTCDDKEQAEKFTLWGIDYITTNILE